MTNKVDKFLRRLDASKYAEILSLIDNIKRGSLEGLDIKRLKGSEILFRVRRGKIRIIFEMGTNNKGNILDIVYRTDTTYNF